MKSINTIRDNKTAIEKKKQVIRKSEKGVIRSEFSTSFTNFKSKEQYGKQLIFLTNGMSIK